MSDLLTAPMRQLLATKSILVISDAYPPHAQGGAEISLHAYLSGLPRDLKKRIIVVSFFNESASSVQAIDGIDVAYLPSAAQWPYEHLAAHEMREKSSGFVFGAKHYARLIKIYQLLKRNNRADVMAAYSEAKHKPKGGLLVDVFLDEKHKQVRDLVAVNAAMPALDLIVADNTRSILIGALLMRQREQRPRSVAIVRDNRFHCARPQQNRTVRGEICKTCAFQCATEDVRDRGAALRRRNLQRTADVRTQGLNQYDTVITTSHELTRNLARVLKQPDKLIRIPNTVGDLRYINSCVIGEAQESMNNLLIIGMLNENKGQLQFVKNATSWLKQRTDVRFVFCGRGDRVGREISKHAESQGLSNRVRLLGFRPREDIFRQIRKATLVVAPTVWPEPFGRVPLEAGALGRAVVAFGVGGLSESIIDGVTGVLVRPGDYAGMLRAVDYLLDNPSARAALETAARSHISEHYTADKHMPAFTNALFSDEPT